MNRIKTNHAAGAFASRPVRIAVAMKIAFAIIAANVSFAAAKAMFAKAPDAPAAMTRTTISSTMPFILPVSGETTAAAQVDITENCRAVEVETDEGYGVRGKVTRVVCRKAL